MRARVQSVVGELRSYKLCSLAKNLKSKVRSFTMLMVFLQHICLGIGEDVGNAQCHFFQNIYIDISSKTLNDSKQTKTRFELQSF